MANGPLAMQAVFGLGYTAVDLFFILSGLILTNVYRDLRLAQVPTFFLKRALRLYPLHLVSLVALILIVTYPAWTATTLWAINWPEQLSSVLLIHPFLNVAPMANPPTWSIGVELVCYLAFPAALHVLRLNSSRLMATILVTCLLLVEYEVLRRVLGATQGIGAVLRGVAGFGLGMALCQLGTGIKARVGLATFGESCGLIGVILATWANEPSAIPLCGALLLFSLSFDSGVVADFLRLPCCVWLGRISFSIYLLHYPLIVAADRWLPVGAFLVGGTAGALLRWAFLLAGLLALSTATYRFVEEPGRHLIRAATFAGVRRRSSAGRHLTP